MNLKNNPLRIFRSIQVRPAMIFGLIIISALFAFEIFNYSTTDFALSDLLGELRFAGIRWATILAIAFCGIDFAGIARLFTPQQTTVESRETWYLFGAWLLAATMNALLTWWGVSLAIANHYLQSSAVVDENTLLRVVPVFVAVMVWLIRILIIGTISTAADQLIWGRTGASTGSARRRPATAVSPAVSGRPQPLNPQNAASSTASRPGFNRPLVTTPPTNLSSRPEPTYHSMSGSNQRNTGSNMQA